MNGFTKVGSGVTFMLSDCTNTACRKMPALADCGWAWLAANVSVDKERTTGTIRKNREGRFLKNIAHLLEMPRNRAPWERRVVIILLFISRGNTRLPCGLSAYVNRHLRPGTLTLLFSFGINK
jgi:hypothetical protein